MHVSPLTLTLVLIISSSLSTPSNKVIPSRGIPISDNMRDNINIPALGIPAVPIEAMVAVTIITKKSLKAKSIP